MIKSLQASLPTAVVACADWLGDEAKLAFNGNVEVIKNSVDRGFWSATSVDVLREPNTPVRNLFMCRDLRDKRKVDWKLLQQIGALLNQSLTIVGDHAAFEVKEARRRPAVSDRGDLARLMQEHDRLVFTSRVDYFPLTIAEALTSGMEVVALDSPAAQEFSHHSRLRIFGTENELLMHLSDTPRLAERTTSSLDRERDFFDPRRMTDEYLDVYSSVLGA